MGSRTPNRSPKRSPGRLSLVIAGLAAILLLPGCGGSASYSSGGVSFQYPKSWRTVLAPASTPGAAGPTTRVGVGLDSSDMVILVTTHIAGVSTAQDVTQTEQALVRTLQSNAQRQGASVQGPAPDSLGGFDGFGMTIVGLSLPGSVVVDSRVIVVVRTGVEYLLNCQSTSAHAEAIGKGCRQVIDSFTLD